MFAGRDVCAIDGGGIPSVDILGITTDSLQNGALSAAEEAGNIVGHEGGRSERQLCELKQ